MKTYMKTLGRIFIIVCAVGIIGVAAGTTAYSQEATQPTGTVTADQVNEVARQLWCPLCSGVRLDSCELKACEQMRQEIALKLEAGEDAESIKSYFLAQYGPQILGEPPREGFNLVAWILPVVALIGGALFLVVRGRRLFTRQSPLGTASVAATQANSPSSDNDPYARQLEEELKQYG